MHQIHERQSNASSKLNIYIVGIAVNSCLDEGRSRPQQASKEVSREKRAECCAYFWLGMGCGGRGQMRSKSGIGGGWLSGVELKTFL